MTGVIAPVANALWLAGCLPEAARFRRATGRVREEQELVLCRLLQRNAETEFGTRHGFCSIRTVADYQRRVPLATYEEYESAIARLERGETNILTRDRVRLFEPTSGSSGAVKHVPYTASLQREFQRGIRPWIADLFLHRPDLANGEAYWSVSPVAAPDNRTAAGIPIGFEDDASYVGGWQQRLARAVMAAPPSLRLVHDLELFRYFTLLALVRSRSLRLISVWHPTFLSWLVDRLEEWGDRLDRDLVADPACARVLRAALRCRTPEERHATLWPHLGLISCWSDANAAAPAAQLARAFPHASLQGKGVIATEAFVSLPLIGHHGAALAVRSHFMEFIPDGFAHGTPRLAHELERHQKYAVVVSTGGGLYRYQLHDVVEVVGHLGECPLVRFIGRQGHVSDWFGEKLNEAYVARVLRDVCARVRIEPCFAMLACDDTLPCPAYVLYIESAGTDTALSRLGAEMDAALCGNFHYSYARRLGQLAPLRVFRAEGAAECYLRAAVHTGQRAGDVKMLALDRRSGWSQTLRGRFIHALARVPPDLTQIEMLDDDDAWRRSEAKARGTH